MSWPKRCTICGITSREMMEICLIPICPPQLQRTRQRPPVPLVKRPPKESFKPGERK